MADEPERADPSKHPDRIGRYPVRGVLGRGGMGVVYLALDDRLGRRVAIKVLPSEGYSEADLRRFEREATTVANLSHPNIGVIHELDRDGDRPFIVMKLIPGMNIAEWLAGGPMPTERVIRIGIQAAAALEAAHRDGIIHRDVKPGNLMLDEHGTATLLDFGIAKIRERERYTTTGDATRTSTFAGTPGYMSPEQLRGRRISPKTDVWALGCVLYECLTAKRAFTGTPSRRQLETGPDWTAAAPDTPAPLVEVVTRCLAYAPHDRPDAGTVRGALEAVRERPDEMPTLPPPRGRAGRTMAVVAVAVLLLLAALAIWRGATAPYAVLGDAVLTEQRDVLAATTPDGRLVFRGALPDSLRSPRVDWKRIAEVQIDGRPMILMGPRVADFRWGPQTIVAWPAPRTFPPPWLRRATHPAWVVDALAGVPTDSADATFAKGASFLDRYLRVSDLDGDGDDELLTVEMEDAWAPTCYRIFDLGSAGHPDAPRETFRYYHFGSPRAIAVGPAPAWLDAAHVLWIATLQNGQAHKDILGYHLEQAADAFLALPLRPEMFADDGPPLVTIASFYWRRRETFARELRRPIAPPPELFTLALPQFDAMPDCTLRLERAKSWPGTPEMTPTPSGLETKAYGYNVSVGIARPDTVTARMSMWLAYLPSCYEQGGLSREDGPPIMSNEELVARMFHLATGRPRVTFLGNFRDVRSAYAARWELDAPTP